MTTCRPTTARVRFLFCAGAVLLASAGTQGCAVYNGATNLARKALDPGVHGPKPLNPEEAAQLTDQQIEKRLEFVTQRLEDNELHAALWYYGFLAVNAGGMV